MYDWFLVEKKKAASPLLSQPLDFVGDDDTPRPVKKAKSGKKKADKKKEEKKTWSREEILSTFLPPSKQKGLPKPRRVKETEKPKKAPKEKKPVPKIVMKEEPSTPKSVTGGI